MDQLEQSLRNQVQAGSILLQRIELEIAQLPESLWPAEGLRITEVQITRLDAAKLVVAGRIDLESYGPASLRITVAGLPGMLVVGSEVDLDVEIKLDRFVKPLIDGIAESIADGLEWVAASGVSWSRRPEGDLHVTVRLVGTTTQTLVATQARVTVDQADFGIGPGGQPFRIRGSLKVGEIVVPITLAVSDRVSISADWPEMSLRDLLGQLSIPLPLLPPLPLVDEPLKGVRLHLGGVSVRLTAQVATNIGMVFVCIARVGTEWGAVAGLHNEGLRFSQLSSALQPMNAALEVIRFATPAVILATLDSEAFPYLDDTENWSTISVSKGGALRGALLLHGKGLDLLGELIGTDRLPLDTPLDLDWSKVHITAVIDDRIDLLGDDVILEDLRISLAPDPFSVSAAGSVQVRLFGTDLPRFILGASLNTGSSALFLAAEEAWEEPLGLPLKISDLGFQIRGPGISYGLFGAILIQNRTMKVATEFVGQLPTLLSGSLDGELPLGAVLLDLVGIDLLPVSIQPQIRDLETYMVVSPAGATIGDRPYPFGLSLSGTLILLGLEVRAVVFVSKTRVRAEGALNKPIRLEPVLEVTGTNGQAAPSFALDTSSDPVAKISARVKFLGIDQALDAIVGSNGIAFSLKQNVGPVGVDLQATLDEGRIDALGTVDFMLRGAIGPIRMLDNGPDLGTIRLDTGFLGQVKISAVDGDTVSVRLSGTFGFLGVTLSIPELGIAITSIEDLPEAVLGVVRGMAIELFVEWISAADKWLELVANKVIEAVEDVARTLKEHFDQTSKQVAEAMRHVLGESLDVTANSLKRIGETTEQVGRILSEIGESPKDIAKALRDIGESPQAIGNVLRILGEGVDEVGKQLEGLGFVGEVVDDALKVVFPDIPGVRWPPHLKHIKVPHLKHVKVPHLKHVKVPHLKHVKVPHLKHVKVPHLKHVKVPHLKHVKFF